MLSLWNAICSIPGLVTALYAAIKNGLLVAGGWLLKKNQDDAQNANDKASALKTRLQVDKEARDMPNDAVEQFLLKYRRK